jgi:hypothetical protein
MWSSEHSRSKVLFSLAPLECGAREKKEVRERRREREKR